MFASQLSSGLWIALLGWMVMTAPSSQVLADSPSIHYVLEYQEGPKVRVSVEFHANDTSSTELRLQSEWGGVQNEGEDVNELMVRDEHRNQCMVERLSPTKWKVHHQPNSKLQAEYIIPRTAAREPLRGNDYRTCLQADSFQMIGYIGLLIPDIAPAMRPIDFQIRFKGFQQVGWDVVSSLGPGEGPFSITCIQEEFQKTMWLAGKLQVQTRRIGTQPIAIAILGSDWQFKASDLADAVEKVVQTERDFFQDHSDPWYLITLTPVVGGPNAYSFGGTALKNCFALFCTQNLEVGTQSADAMRTLTLLAHEYFHNWNGIKIPTASEDPETYWFSEGFTNFYARRILQRAGIMSDSLVLEDLNEALGKFEMNPHRLASNRQIVDSFWKDRQLQELPYQRGDMIAILIDEHIRSRTQGTKSLDDFMIDLFRNPPPPPVTSQLLLQRIGDWVDAEMLATISQSVFDGKEVPIPKALTLPQAMLSQVPSKKLDPGFDFEETKKEKVIVGVDDGNHAYRAGLRNGQKIQKLSIFSGDHPKAELTVEVEGKPKTIVYEPTTEGPMIRAYRPVP